MFLLLDVYYFYACINVIILIISIKFFPSLIYFEALITFILIIKIFFLIDVIYFKSIILNNLF